jgi:hypothetical protein
MMGNQWFSGWFFNFLILFLITRVGPLTAGFRKAKEPTREPGFGPIGLLTAGFENQGRTF